VRQQDHLENKEVINKLLQELNVSSLPLAITQASAYMNENQVNIAEYLQLLRNKQARIWLE
jgi:hypothetical protein